MPVEPLGSCEIESRKRGYVLLTELHTAEIPDVYARFASVVGDKHWKQRVAVLKQEIKGNPFLRDHLMHENALAFQLDRLREMAEKFGRVPPWEVNNHELFPAASFCAQVLSFMDISPKQLSAQFRRRVHGALKNPDDMRGLRLEFAAATHFLRRRRTASWPEMTGEGTFDLLVTDVGPTGLEVECKSISIDKGRKIHKRESLDFFSLLHPHLKSTIVGLSSGLSAAITVPGRLPTSFRDRQALAKDAAAAIFHGHSATLSNGCVLRLNDFDVSRLGNVSRAQGTHEVREAMDEVTGTSNRHTLIIGTGAGGALALAIQSAGDDTFMDSVFCTLKDSASRQMSGQRGGMFFVGFQGIDGNQLRSIASQDEDPAQHATALRIGVSNFLGGTGRDHVIGVGFLSESGLSPAHDGLVESGGTAYYFPKRESPFWSESFSPSLSIPH